MTGQPGDQLVGCGNAVAVGDHLGHLDPIDGTSEIETDPDPVETSEAGREEPLRVSRGERTAIPAWRGAHSATCGSFSFGWMAGSMNLANDLRRTFQVGAPWLTPLGDVGGQAAGACQEVGLQGWSSDHRQSVQLGRVGVAIGGRKQHGYAAATGSRTFRTPESVAEVLGGL